MHLKRLELFGFKTFADRTELEFLPGVTAVVGPNGSGKSNIADAIQWVLGEQSMRSLRSLSSQDVIFAGTHRRKPLGFAEASLTLDNSSRALPLEFDEVTVTRRLFRSGDSEYQINKVSCRLKDIVELFLDTGIGYEAYSIIGQSEIDAVLSIRAEDRRALVEEAAGIKKYRVRKREATRKLESTQANLTRVADIIAEVERQLPPLREQAEVAGRYREIRDRAQALERALLVTEHRRALQQVEQIRAARQAAADKVDLIQAEIARIESESEAARLAVTRADAALDEARTAFSAATQQVERARGNLGVSQERLNALESAEAGEADRIADLERSLERCRQQQAEIAEPIPGALAAEKAAGDALRAREEELAGVNRRMAEVGRAVEEHRRKAVERARALTNAQADLRSAVRRVQDTKSGVERSRQRVEVLAARGETQDAREEKLRGKVTEAEAHCQALVQENRQGELERATLQREILQRNQRAADLRNEMTARSARLRTLRELEEKFEGYQEGARTILKAQKEGRIKGRFVPVADLLEVAPEFEPAIQAALGGSLDALVAGSLAEARDAIRYLRAQGGGRATFIASDARIEPNGRAGEWENGGAGESVPTGSAGSPTPPLSHSPALPLNSELARRCATHHVRCSEAHRQMVHALLGDAVVVQHLDEAQEVLRLDHARFRAVTMEGDLLHPAGMLTGGRTNGGGGSLLARRREMGSLQEEIAHLDATLLKESKEGEAQTAALRTLETALRRKRDDGANAASALAAAKKDLDYAVQERKRLADELRRAEDGIRQAETDVEKAIAGEARLRERVEALEAQDTGADADIGRSQALLEELGRQRDRASEAVSEQKVAAARARQQAEGLRENGARAGQQETELTRDIQRRREEAATRAGRLAAVREEITRQEAELKGLAKTQEQSQQYLDECRETRRRLLEVSAKVEQRSKEARDRLSAAQGELHRAEVKLAGVEADIQHAQTSLYEQYGLTPEEIERLSTEEVTEVRNRQQASQELRQLRAQMADLGEVNLGAIEEVHRLAERLEFLTTQHGDLVAAREGLLQVIAEIDLETRDRFVRTMDALRVAFQETFSRLFGGGTTLIKFTDDANVLEGGLEIIVQPPGKKPQSMLLLSGGERALTAAAFLFALLKIKPSPFVLLDEVDAPLDETNVTRFAAMLRDFAERSQFIVITHSRGTMESADVLYGVTMPEPGISKVVSMRLEDVPAGG